MVVQLKVKIKWKCTILKGLTFEEWTIGKSNMILSLTLSINEKIEKYVRNNIHKSIVTLRFEKEMVSGLLYELTHN